MSDSQQESRREVEKIKEEPVISEDFLNVIGSGKVKESSSNKLSLLMDSSSEEEEVISPKKKRSIMSRNEVEEDTEGGFLSDGYDADLYGDAEDRARLYAMTEVEREAIIYERAQVRQARLERRALERRLRENEAGAVSGGRRGPSNEVDLKRKRLDELKYKRDKKKKTGAQLESGEESEEGEEEGEYSTAEEEEEEPSMKKKLKKKARRRAHEDSDEDYYEEAKEQSRGRGLGKVSMEEVDVGAEGEREDAVVTELDLDLANKLRLTRDIMAQWIYRDGFESVAKGCLLRINLGPGKSGIPVYRLVELKEIVPYQRTYLLKEGHPTNQAALVKFVKNERVFRLEFVSNSPFTEAELRHWKQECLGAGVKIPYNSRHARRKISQLKDFYAQPMNDGAIAKILEKRRQLTSSQAAPRNLLAEQTILQQQWKEALERGAADEVIRIEGELMDLGEKKDSNLAARSGHDRLAVMKDLNKRNRLANLETGRQAEINRLQIEQGSLEGASAATAARAGASVTTTLDPFQRRKCKPTIIHMGDGVDEKTLQAGDQVEEKVAGKAVEAPAHNDAKTTTAMGSKSLYDVHNFDLDLDI